MAVTVANAGPIQPVLTGEVTCVALGAGPFDNVDAYVQGGQWGSGQLQFLLYATVGGVVGIVAVADYQGPGPGRLTWNGGSPVHAGGTDYTLKVRTTQPQDNSGILPTPISVTLAGVNAGDVAADTNASATVTLPADTSEVTVTTAAGFIDAADVSCNMAGLPALRFNLYADCGAGSVVCLIASGTSGGPDASAAVLREEPLSVATNYTLKVQKVVSDAVAGIACTAALSTYIALGGGGGGGGGILAPEVTGPIGTNVLSGPFSVASLAWKAAVVGPTWTQLISAAGAGAAMSYISQAAAVGSGLNGGDITVGTGAGDGAGVSGNVKFSFGGVVKADIEEAFGIIQAGGDGLNAAAFMGPFTGSETTDTAVWLLPNATARTITNYAIRAGSGDLFLNTTLSNGIIHVAFGPAGTNYYWTLQGFQFFDNTPHFGGGNGVIGVAAATTAPTTNPSTGMILYVDPADGSTKIRGSSGDVTIIAIA